jgi:hypothetical protein
MERQHILHRERANRTRTAKEYKRAKSHIIKKRTKNNQKELYKVF